MTLFDDEEGVSRVIPSIVTAAPGGTSSSMMHPPLLGVAIAVIGVQAMMVADTLPILPTALLRFCVIFVFAQTIGNFN